MRVEPGEVYSTTDSSAIYHKRLQMLRLLKIISELAKVGSVSEDPMLATSDLENSDSFKFVVVALTSKSFSFCILLLLEYSVI